MTLRLIITLVQQRVGDRYSDLVSKYLVLMVIYMDWNLDIDSGN